MLHLWKWWKEATSGSIIEGWKEENNSLPHVHIFFPVSKCISWKKSIFKEIQKDLLLKNITPLQHLKFQEPVETFLDW